MKKRYLLAVLTSLALVISVTAWAGTSSKDKVTGDDVKRELRNAAEVIRQYAVAQRQEAIHKAEELLQDLDRHIEELERTMDEKWAHMSETARARTRETLKALRQQRNEVAEWYGGLKHGSDGAWEQMKKGFSDAYADLGDAWQKAREEFEKDR